MESDLPDFEDAAEQLANLSKSNDIPFLCSDDSPSLDTGFALGGDKDADGQSSINVFDGLFQSQVQVPLPLASFMFDPPSLGALQLALAANSPHLDIGGSAVSPQAAVPLNAGAHVGFLSSPPPALLTDSTGKQRSRVCSFYFPDLKAVDAKAHITKMVKQLIEVQKSGSTSGIKLERNPTFFVDSFTAHRVSPDGVWIPLTSSSTQHAKWGRVAKTIGASDFRLIPQNVDSGKLIHSYKFIAKQFGLADDDEQLFQNTVHCDELPQVFSCCACLWSFSSTVIVRMIVACRGRASQVTGRGRLSSSARWMTRSCFPRFRWPRLGISCPLPPPGRLS